MTSFPALGYRVRMFTAAVVIGLMVILFSIGIGGLVRAILTPDFPVEVSNRPGRPVVLEVVPGNGGDARELRPGDVITRIEGQGVEDLYYALHLSRLRPPGSWVRVEVVRDGHAVDLEMRSDPGVFPLPLRRVLIGLFLLVSWGVILLIFWRRPRDPVAIATAVAGGAALAVLGIENPLLGYGRYGLRVAWTAVFIILVGAVGPLFLHWSLLYPVRVTTRRWIFVLFYGAAALVTGLALVELGRQYTGLRFDPLFRAVGIQSAVDIVLVLAATGTLLRTYRRSLSPRQRLPVKWVILGVCVGVLPQALLVMIPNILRIKPVFPSELSAVCLFAIPLSFLASILRYRLFDVDLVVRRSTSLGLLVIAVVLLKALLGFVELPAGLEGEAVRWATSGLMVAVPAVVFRRHLDQPLGVARVQPVEVRGAVASALAVGGAPEVVAARAVDTLVDLLEIGRGAVFLHDPVRDGYALVHAVGGRSAIETEPFLAADGPLANWVRGRRGPIRATTYDRPFGLDLLPSNERRIIDSLDTAIIFPLLAGSRMPGFVMMGAHRSGRLPNTVALRVLDEAGRAIGAAVDRAFAERATMPDSSFGPGLDARSTASRGEALEEDDRPPGAIGPYRIQELIGEGSYGRVWSAIHEPTRRVVALKVLRRHLVSDRRAFRHFAEEIRVLAEIDDPYIVRILDYGNEEGVPWFAMEMVRGESLRDRLRKHRTLDPPKALMIASQVARGLAACHGVGVVHRDLSPGNILLSGKRVRIADLGLAHRVMKRQDAATLSQTGVGGTILYMAPEQVSGRKLTYASDLFSLGAILYESLAGQSPFEGGSLADIVARIGRAEFEPLERIRPDLPREVVVTVSAMLARRPPDRLGPAGKVARHLDRLSRLQFSQLEKIA